MRKTYLTASLALALNAFAQDANVSLSNISSNNGYSSYNTSTGMVEGLFFEILSDGDNSTNVFDDSFQTSVYLLPCNSSGSPTSSTPVIIKTYDISSMYQLHSLDYSNESIDLTQVSGLSDGMYRLGVWVNSDNGVPNPPDDPNDNAYMLTSSAGTAAGSVINFSSSVGIAQINAQNNLLKIFPNPANSVLQVSTVNYQADNIQIYDVLSNQILKNENLKLINGKQQIDISNLQNGIYYIKVGNSTQKFIKN